MQSDVVSAFGWIVGMLCAVFVGLIILSNWWTHHIVRQVDGSIALDKALDHSEKVIGLQTQFLGDVSDYQARQRDPAALAEWLATTAVQVSGKDIKLARPPAPSKGDGNGKREPGMVSSDRV